MPDFCRAFLYMSKKVRSKIGKKIGRKTDLTKEMLSKIKQSIIDGNDLRATAKICDIIESTLYGWTADNYLNLSDKVEGWKRDRKIMLATENLEEMLKMSITNKGVTKDGKEIYEFDDTGILRVKADMTKFALETLDKGNYSKRTENTGKDGQPIIVEIIKYEEDNTTV